MRERLPFIAAAITAWLAFALPAQAARSLAFVAGTDEYKNLDGSAQLRRAINDSRSVARALSGLGYAVTAKENLDRRGFNDAWQEFLDKISAGDVAFFYFSGHGIEIEGLNFLLPSDVPAISYGRQEQIKRESISVSELLLDLKKKKPKVVVLVLDACRDNPLIPTEYRSAARKSGLAGVEAPEGTFIMYSAGTGETALDRLPGKRDDDPNSVYTRALLPLLSSGIGLAEMARQLRQQVSESARTVGHLQRPAYYDGLIGRFCISQCAEPVETLETHKLSAKDLGDKSPDYKAMFESQYSIIFNEPLACVGTSETACRKLEQCKWTVLWTTKLPGCTRK